MFLLDAVELFQSVEPIEELGAGQVLEDVGGPLEPVGQNREGYPAVPWIRSKKEFTTSKT